MGVRDTFDRVAAEYDAVKHRILPGYAEMRATVDRWSASDPDAPLRALELGCGTGSWAAAFLDRHPAAELVAVEFSARMREVAVVELERFGARARIVDLDLNDGLPDGEFDVVTSTLAIHHVLDKALLARRAHALLAPGGRFVWADLIDPGTDELRALFSASWAEFMRANGIDEAGIQGVFDDHETNDLPVPVEAQLGFLRDAGFADVAVLWQRELFAVCYGRRPS